jgi:hypothetical protein
MVVTASPGQRGFCGRDTVRDRGFGVHKCRGRTEHRELRCDLEFSGNPDGCCDPVARNRGLRGECWVYPSIGSRVTVSLAVAVCKALTYIGTLPILMGTESVYATAQAAARVGLPRNVCEFDYDYLPPSNSY